MRKLENLQQDIIANTAVNCEMVQPSLFNIPIIQLKSQSMSIIVYCTFSWSNQNIGKMVNNDTMKAMKANFFAGARQVSKKKLSLLSEIQRCHTILLF